MLQARLFERAEQISGKRSGRYQGDWDPDEMSILTGVMGITKEVSRTFHIWAGASADTARLKSIAENFESCTRKADSSAS
jgi:hypothetical protein